MSYHYMKFGTLSFLALSLLISPLAHAANNNDSDLDTTIQYLLNTVRTSGYVFIRNGNSYSSEEAAQHIQKKYLHFQADIHTPEDFIRLAATRSTVSGEPYKVQAPDGQLLSSEMWLTQLLRRYREKNSAPASAPTKK